MNQSSSSSTHKHKSSSPAWPEENMKKKHHQQQQWQKQRFRYPFQDLNNSANDSSSNASSVASVEAPKACLRFFLSQTTSSTKTQCSNSSSNHGPIKGKLLSTPKSAPSMRPQKENSSKRFIFHRPISQKLDKVQKNPPKPGRKPSLRKDSSSKFYSVLNSSGSTENKLKSSSRELKQVVVDGCSDLDGSNSTPLSKMAGGSGSNLAVDDERSKTNSNSNTNSTSSNSKTPPVQASVSPELQCGSSMVTTTTKTITPVCYAAGYVMSGVTDKRKCRPRGILTAGEAKPLGCYDSDDETERENDLGLVNNSSISVLPLPSEASMHWLLSPCNEEDEEHKENSENELFGFSRLEDSPVSPSPENGVFSQKLCDNGSKSRWKGLCSALLSPSRGVMGPPSYYKATDLCSEKARKNCSGLEKENSPFFRDSLGSGNVIQTPHSDSSSERQVGISWLNVDGDRKIHNLDFEFNSIAEHIRMACLSPKSHLSIRDPASSSFQFDCLTTPSDSDDLSHFQRVVDDRDSWFSNSTMETVSQSQMRISWREGLVSRIFEMDEFDTCKCLSDAEDDANVCNLKSPSGPELNVNAVNKPISANGSGSTIHVKSEHGNDRKSEEEFPHQVPCSCAESISTDGGSLVRSEDSDWTLCYKNHFFQ